MLCKLRNIAVLCVFFSVSVLGAETVFHTFTGSREVIFNPERGFWRFGPLVDGVNYNTIREAGVSLCYGNILLDDFRSSEISQARLDEIGRAFSRIRASGIKTIVRITYDNTAAGEDATLEWMEVHLSQLRPVLEDNSDVIAFFQAGMIGAWGEWHSSSNNHNLNPEPVWDLLVEYLPADRFIAVRTPRFVNALEGLDTNPLEPEEAFTFESRARIAHHNDCWLSSNTDMGTYDGNPGIRQQEKDQVANQSKYTPWGGETCMVSSYSHCETAIAEAKRFHASYMHDGWNPDVVDVLKDEGCWGKEFAKWLGYRFKLIDGELPAVIVQGRQFAFSVRLRNFGWAAPYNERPVILLLLSGDEVVAEYDLSESYDPRRWLGEDGDIIVSGVVRAPGDIDAETVDLAVWLPDPALGNRSNPDYSIRFANEGTWDAAGGYNILKEGIPVTSYVGADCDNNGRVDIDDFVIMAGYWLSDCEVGQTCESCDADETGWIDFEDFAGLSKGWTSNHP